MTIASIKRTVEVALTPPQAFDLFVNRMGDWWPKTKTPGINEHVAIVVEPHQGGRWVEMDRQGTETQWGKVLAWEPPGRLVLGWQLNGEFRYDPDLITEVELTFSSSTGGTMVSLEHRDLERFGSDAERMVQAITGGWTSRLSDFAAAAAETQAQAA